VRRRDGFAAIAFLIWTAAAGAQTTVPTSNSNEIVAVRTAMPPVIDGVIGEDEWKGAAMATGFIQYEPRRGEPSGVRTEAIVLFDAGHLYVGFRVWDGEPITAQLTQRDADLFTDDAVAVVLDTTLDKRSGCYFITNALGRPSRWPDIRRRAQVAIQSGRAMAICGPAHGLRMLIE